MIQFLNIKLTAQNLELIIAVLRKRPHDEVHDLVMDLHTQMLNETKALAKETQVPKAPKVSKAPKPAINPLE